MNVERIKAVATIIVTAAVNVANVIGYAVDAEPWLNATLSVISVVAIIYSWWKNNNVTEAAQQGQLVIDTLKAEKKAAEING